VIKELESVSKDSTQLFKFHSLDVTNTKKLLDFTSTYKQKLDGLVICAGGLNSGQRRVTEDGVEVGFAQNYLSRFIMIHQLLPLLGNARVVDCLGAGTGVKVDPTDFQVEKPGYLPNFIRSSLNTATLVYFVINSRTISW
jgi:NAD(P)-dependent dehydrogenase (short-subunit alcohol dehydrogenase family)